MDDDYTVILIPGLPSLTEVRLYDETWDYIAKRHPEFRLELPSQRDALEDAIATPTAIHASTTDPEKAVIIVSSSFTYLDHPVVVPVRRVPGTTSGRVTTAYFSSSTYLGPILWSAGNE